MRSAVSAVLIAFCFILQSTLFAKINIAGVTPNLLLILTASIGFRVGRKNGLIVGFVCGLLCDIFFGTVMGLYAIIYMYIGYINGAFKKVLFPGDLKLPVILIAGSDFIYGNVIYLLMFFIKGDFKYFFYMRTVILPELIYTTLIAFLLFPLINLLFNQIERREKLIEGEEEYEELEELEQ